MVGRLSHSGLPERGDDDTREAYYEQLVESWPAERPSSRKKRAYQRKRERRVEVRAERREQPSTARMSKALLAAQREVAKLQAEADARAESKREAPNADR